VAAAFLLVSVDEVVFADLIYRQFSVTNTVDLVVRRRSNVAGRAARQETAMRKTLLAAAAAFFMLGASIVFGGAPVSAQTVVIVDFNDLPWQDSNAKGGTSANSADAYEVRGFNSSQASAVFDLAAGTKSVLINGGSTPGNGATYIAGGGLWAPVSPLSNIDLAGVGTNASGQSAHETYGSGAGLSGGIGTYGDILPSYYIETTSGPDIYEGALIANWANSAGQMVGTPFAPGDSELVNVPTGATELMFGSNADDYNYLSGSWNVDVAEYSQVNGAGSLMNAGVTGGVPESPTYLMAALGFLAMAAFGARRSQAHA
jgi:hypothetical protein